MLLAECLRNIRTTFACGHSGSAKPFSLLKTVTEDRHTPENVEGLPVGYTPSHACQRGEAKQRKREAREREFMSRERGSVRVRSVLVSVGFGLLLHGGNVLSPPTHQVSLSFLEKARIFSPPCLSSILACMLRLCSRTGMYLSSEKKNEDTHTQNTHTHTHTHT